MSLASILMFLGFEYVTHRGSESDTLSFMIMQILPIWFYSYAYNNDLKRLEVKIEKEFLKNWQSKK